METVNYMGKVWSDVELSNASDEFLVTSGKLAAGSVRKTQVHALVDSGATMLVLPLESIKALGLELTRTARSRFADGTFTSAHLWPREGQGL